MQLHQLRLLAGCLVQSLRHSDSPSFATNIYYEPKARDRSLC
jgi:hypothetical protein